MQNSYLLEARNLFHDYRTNQAAEPLSILKGLNFGLKGGETVAIVGQSGSGKSTLLSLLAGLDKPRSGSVHLSGVDYATLDDNALTLYRAQHLSLVFQQFHLVPHLTALENIALPLQLLKTKKNPFELARFELSRVGLEKRADHFPDQLSGGEKQRVAIARALITEPSVLLADEPSGNLDQETGNQVMQLFFDQVKKTNVGTLLVTHNLELAKRCDRTLTLSAGTLHAL